MPSKLSLRCLLVFLFALAFSSLARADIYVTYTQNTGTYVTKTADAPYMYHFTGGYSPLMNLWLTDAGTSLTEVWVVANTHNPKGDYNVATLWDSGWLDSEDVYITIQ